MSGQSGRRPRSRVHVERSRASILGWVTGMLGWVANSQGLSGHASRRIGAIAP
jgi:hypothetical protein